jgi:hypothetical protein
LEQPQPPHHLLFQLLVLVLVQVLVLVLVLEQD